MYDSLLAFGNWLEKSPMAYAVVEWDLLSDFCWVGHFFSFFLVVGTSVAVDVRLLGLGARRQTASELAEQLFPWTWAGLGLATLTGFLYLTPSAWIFFRSSFFFIKLLLTFLAAVSVLLIQWNVRKWDRQSALPPLAKVMAVISLLLWISVLIAGTHVPVQTCF